MSARGSAYIELEVKGRIALSLLTGGWKDEEVDALYSGDDGAREALKDQLIEIVMRESDELDVITFELNLAARG